METFGPDEILFLFRLADGLEADRAGRFNASVWVQAMNEGPLTQTRGGHGTPPGDKV
jgi:hypothetical protein